MKSTTLAFCQIEYASPEYDDSLRLRYRILRAPLGLDYTEEQIIEEWDSYHFGLYDQNQFLKASLTFKAIDEHTLKMRQVVVDQDVQGQGLGKILVSQAEHWALNQGFKNIELHARDTSVPFYLSMDYIAEGAPFVEVGIAHQKMEKHISQQIAL